MKVGSEKAGQLQACGCGCGRVAHWHRLHLLRGPGQESFFVLDECRTTFADELTQREKLRALRDALRGTFFWERWRAARAWYVLQFATRARLLGPDEAGRVARRDTMLFVMPGWVARLVLSFKC
ncbi:MAG TPA: hypothetical protein VG733_12880 [Chthoniobacteraceae bacterium]|nr:hypothetical protein [Chthoniobacteraceae bacterium]